MGSCQATLFILNIPALSGEENSMASTSMTLGPRWEKFIKKQIDNGRYNSTSELVRESLRLLEERETKLQILHAALIEGEQSGSAGALDMDAIKQKAKLRRQSEQ